MRTAIIAALAAPLLTTCMPAPDAAPDQSDPVVQGSAPAPVVGDTAVHEGVSEDIEGSRRVFEEAARRGVTFRAVGQEPGWVLDIHPDRLELLADYGERRVTAPAPQPESDAGTTVYHAVTESADLRVTIREQPCTDTMSGEPFSHTVTLVLDGREYAGCGRPLQ